MITPLYSHVTLIVVDEIKMFSEHVIVAIVAKGITVVLVVVLVMMLEVETVILWNTVINFIKFSCKLAT